jgi:hypothetical protein
VVFGERNHGTVRELFEFGLIDDVGIFDYGEKKK